MNRSTGSIVSDKWLLTFEGGPLDGKTKKWHCLPETTFAKRDKKTGEQFQYVVKEVEGNRAKMVLQ